LKVEDENKVYYIYVGLIFLFICFMLFITSGIDESIYGTNRIIVKHNVLTKYAILYGLLSSTTLISVLYYFFRNKAIVAIALWKLSFGVFSVFIYFNLGIINNYYDESTGEVFDTVLMVPTRTIYSRELIRRNSCVEIQNPSKPNESFSKLYYCYRKPWKDWPGKEILSFATPGKKVRITVRDGYFGAKWVSNVRFN
jgi:hypothetical protein